MIVLGIVTVSLPLILDGVNTILLSQGLKSLDGLKNIVALG